MADIARIDPRWAWEPYRPDAKNPWNLKKAGHLYRRAAFGASWPELEKAVKQGLEQTITTLFQGGAGQEPFEKQTAEMKDTVIIGQTEELMRAWWLYRLLATPHPLREKMTLCWHNHFATSNNKVNNIRHMLGQNELIRKHALSNFGTMIQEMSKDPAMMVWLDTNLNKKGTPNENYSRELMELFSLGRGNYTETDVREGARAFTGWEIKEDRFFFNKSQHDAGEKNYLGKSANLGGEDVVRMCLEHEACPYFITGKLYRFFVSETAAPSRELLEPLAAQFRKEKLEIAGVVATILRSNLFFSEHAYRQRVKAPTDFAVGIIRALEGRVGTVGLADALEGLGQKLFYPPSVKGWDGGTGWINSNSLLLRHNLALALTSTQDQRFGRRTDPAALARKYGKHSDDEVVEFLVALFLQSDLAPESRARLVDYLAKARKGQFPVYWTEQDADDHRIRAVCHLLLTQPEFQLD